MVNKRIMAAPADIMGRVGFGTGKPEPEGG
jgi:hypothetical protein